MGLEQARRLHMRFRNRNDAGRRLAELLGGYRAESPIVLALPRGGVPVAHEVAQALAAPLDVLVVRKLGVPFQPELAMGAIAEDDGLFLDQSLITRAGLTAREVEQVAAREAIEVRRRVEKYRGGHPLSRLTGRTVLLIDDGLSTGVTLRAALDTIRRHQPRKVVVAVPVAGADAVEELRGEVDELLVAYMPASLRGIDLCYDDFHEISDKEVLAALSAATEPQVRIRTRSAQLEGELRLPQAPRGLVLFAHASGSSRFSPRNRVVASALNDAGLATLLFDLLTPQEEILDQEAGRLRFNIELLGARLAEATDWVRDQEGTQHLPIGFFGASTGAAAALLAAARRPRAVRAVVSRGGRPDLAAGYLARVHAPTLLIVGEKDREVLKLNQQALDFLEVPEKELVIVPGATHLFEEPGTMEQVADLAAAWFARHLEHAPGRAALPLI